MTVRPIARPAIFANGPRSSTAVAKTTQTRKNVVVASISTAFPTARPSRRRRGAARDGVEGLRRREVAEGERGGDGARELRNDVDERARARHLPGHPQARLDRGVEHAAGEVRHGGDHDRDRQAVGEGDRDDVQALGGDDRHRLRRRPARTSRRTPRRRPCRCSPRSPLAPETVATRRRLARGRREPTPPTAPRAKSGTDGLRDSLARVEVLLVSPDARSRELMALVSAASSGGSERRCASEPRRTASSGCARRCATARRSWWPTRSRRARGRSHSRSSLRDDADPFTGVDRHLPGASPRRVARQVVGCRRMVREAGRPVRGGRSAAGTARGRGGTYDVPQEERV